MSPRTTPWPSRRLRRALRLPDQHENSGVAAVEFAICATIFLTILAGTIDIGLTLYTDFQLDTAVNAGAQYTLNNTAMVGSNPSTLSSNILSIVNDLNGTGTNTVNVNNSNDGTHCYCPSGSPGNWSWGSAVACGSTCNSGVAGQFVAITASRTITSIFPAFGFVPNSTISRSVLVETQ